MFLFCFVALKVIYKKLSKYNQKVANKNVSILRKIFFVLFIFVIIHKGHFELHFAIL